MSRRNIDLMLFVVIFPVLLCAQQLKLLTPPILDLGTVPSDTIAEGRIRFVNDGNEPMTIKKVQTSCGCTVANLSKLTYAPGEEGNLPVQFNTKGYSGMTRKTVTIYLEKGQPKSVRVVLQTKVTPKIEVEPEFVNFQHVKLNAGKIKKSFKVTNNTKHSVKIKIGTNKKSNFLVEPLEFSIDAGKKQIIHISYKPTKPGRDDSAVLLRVFEPFRKIKRVPVFVNVLK